MNTPLTIGALARREGVTAEALRYYERLGLIESSRRTASNYRLYDGEARRRLRFVRRAQELGFSLTQIGEMLSLHARPEADMSEVKVLAESKIADISAKINDLQRMKSGLEALTAHCPGHGLIAGCPILNALLKEDPE
ncbi:MerR family DNA-binding protein [Acidihalobacter aeolianus]|nr:MerR family DNA-binding protein [Acidihalobacter aeolianus]